MLTWLEASATELANEEPLIIPYTGGAVAIRAFVNFFHHLLQESKNVNDANGPVTRYMNAEACIEELEGRLGKIREICDRMEENRLGLDGPLLEIRRIASPSVAPIPVEV
jgi:predicted transcriptional regulator